ncbi:MAG TPA: hypothetical protein VIM30_10395 [Candidatus Limnocylindrales bacterium]
MLAREGPRVVEDEFSSGDGYGYYHLLVESMDGSSAHAAASLPPSFSEIGPATTPPEGAPRRETRFEPRADLVWLEPDGSE